MLCYISTYLCMNISIWKSKYKDKERKNFLSLILYFRSFLCHFIKKGTTDIIKTWSMKHLFRSTAVWNELKKTCFPISFSFHLHFTYHFLCSNLTFIVVASTRLRRAAARTTWTTCSRTAQSPVQSLRYKIDAVSTVLAVTYNGNKGCPSDQVKKPSANPYDPKVIL